MIGMLDAMWSHECLGALAAAERATGDTGTVDPALCTPELRRRIPGRIPSEAAGLVVFALGLLGIVYAAAAPCRRRHGLRGTLGCVGACVLVWAAAAYLVADWDHAAVVRTKLFGI